MPDEHSVTARTICARTEPGTCRHPRPLHKDGGPCLAKNCHAGPGGGPCPGFVEPAGSTVPHARAPGMYRDPAERELTSAWAELASVLTRFQNERGLTDTQMLVGVSRWLLSHAVVMAERDKESST